MKRAELEELETLLMGIPPLPWRWQQDKLIGGDGTVILWVSIDVNGERYIGAQADCEVFISAARQWIEKLLIENEALRQRDAA